MDDDETIEEFAASQDAEPKVMESKEVVLQRIRDLSAFLKSNLPALFSGDEDSPSLRKPDLMMVLKELDDEFSYSYAHRLALMAMIAAKVTAVVSPIADATPESEMTRSDMSAEDLEEIQDEHGAVHGAMEVLWDTLMPALSGDLGHLMDIASIPVTCVFNSFLWDDPSWDTVAENMIDSLEPLLEYFVGMTGFLMMIVYIQVMEYKTIPKMTYHIHR